MLALNESTRLRLLEAAVEKAADSILITDAEQEPPGPRIVYVNEGFSRLTGYAPEDVLGKTPRVLQGPKTDRAVLNRLRDQLTRGAPFTGEAINYRKDGSEFVMQWDMVPLINEAGTITHWMSTQRDKTERRQREDDILKADAKHLQSAQRQLETLSRHLEDLERVLPRSADVALDKDAPTPEHLLADARSAIRELGRMLYPVNFEAGSLRFALQELADLAEEQYDISCSFRAEHPVTVSDKDATTKLYSIASEAISHAIHERGASTLLIGLSTNGPTLTLTVRDDGEDAPEVISDGSAIGTVRRYARSLGGVLDVTPNGQGTLLLCTVPLPA